MVGEISGGAKKEDMAKFRVVNSKIHRLNFGVSPGGGYLTRRGVLIAYWVRD